MAGADAIAAPARAGTQPHAAPASGDPGFGIYVHWPFCLAKCPYCDFNSHVRHGGPDEARFRAALVSELRWFAAQAPGERVRSVFFGGGTPSLMSPATVAAVIDEIAALWASDTAPEITLEANPTSVEAGRFAGYRAAGVNRVSLGVQALNDHDLERLGRQHSAREALDALDVARAHFERVSFDLIYARPRQSEADWRSELSAALGHAGEHLSLYQLTIEQGTRFFDLHRAGKLVVPDDERAADLYEATQEICEAAGLPAYEISNHARPGAECRHNMIYWQGGRWAGIGPGAHSRLGGDGAPRRALAGERHPEGWAEMVERSGSGAIDDRLLDAGDAAGEHLLMALRTSEGLDLARYAAIGGAIDDAEADRLASESLVERDETHIRLTARGRLVANAVIAALA